MTLHGGFRKLVLVFHSFVCKGIFYRVLMGLSTPASFLFLGFVSVNQLKWLTRLREILTKCETCSYFLRSRFSWVNCRSSTVNLSLHSLVRVQDINSSHSYQSYSLLNILLHLLRDEEIKQDSKFQMSAEDTYRTITLSVFVSKSIFYEIQNYK